MGQEHQGQIQDFLKGVGGSMSRGRRAGGGGGEYVSAAILYNWGFWGGDVSQPPPIFFFFFLRFNPFRVYFEACGNFNYTSNSQKEFFKF